MSVDITNQEDRPVLTNDLGDRETRLLVGGALNAATGQTTLTFTPLLIGSNLTTTSIHPPLRVLLHLLTSVSTSNYSRGGVGILIVPTGSSAPTAPLGIGTLIGSTGFSYRPAAANEAFLAVCGPTASSTIERTVTFANTLSSPTAGIDVYMYTYTCSAALVVYMSLTAHLFSLD